MRKLFLTLLTLVFAGSLYGQSITGPTTGSIMWENDGSGTTTVVNFPANVAGDLLVALISESNNPGNPTNMGHVAPPGWTMVISTNNIHPSFPSGLYVAWRVSPIGGITNETFTANNITGYVSRGLVFQGVDTLAPIATMAISAPSTIEVSAITAPAASPVADSSLVVWIMIKGGASATFTSIPGTFNVISSNIEPGRGTTSIWSQATQTPPAAVPSQTFTWINEPQYAIAATLVLNPAPPSIPVPPSSITILDTQYNMQNDTLAISLVFQVNDLDLDSLYFWGPWSHPVLAVDGATLPAPFTSPQTFVLRYDVSSVIDSQTVSGIIDSRTFRNGLRSSPPLAIPFSWTRINLAQVPIENLALWYNSNANVVRNQIMDKDVVSVPMATCDTLEALFTYGRPLSFGIIDTIKVSLVSTNIQGCTLFVPRTRQTSWMFKDYLFTFNTSGVTGFVIPTIPGSITLDTLP